MGKETEIINAEKLLIEASRKHNIRISLLVAETALWASPEVHRYLVKENGYGIFFPNTRRAKVGEGEKRRTQIDGVTLDDNLYANNAIKRSIGVPNRQLRGFETCHIWLLTCYDPRYHTAIANLVLLPRALAALSDHDREIQASLQYRSYELYRWYPEDVEKPRRPSFYPSCWRDPFPFSQTVENSLRRRSQGLSGAT